MMSSPSKNMLLPLLLSLLAGGAFCAPPPVVVWLVIGSVASALLAGLSLTCVFLFSMLTES